MTAKMWTPDGISTRLQQELDSEHEGWTMAHYTVLVGLERVNSDGELETDMALYSPHEQADYISAGLLEFGAAVNSRRTRAEDR